jgi:16S rRNA (uracil1498-N3)-methyltransferase
VVRLFVRDDLLQGLEIGLEAHQSHYLTGVMRLGVGSPLHLFNGRDGEWRALIVSVAKRHASVVVETQTRAQSAPPHVELIVALVKRGRLETIVEKAAELGARRVRLMITQRTNADRTNVGRLGLIALEAAEQTGRLDVPEILPPEPLERTIKAWDGSRRLMFCDEAGDASPIWETLAEGSDARPWSLLIGPEGGFSPSEREQIRAMPGVAPVSLGPRILRADTAAIAALALWQAALGDWRP